MKNEEESTELQLLQVFNAYGTHLKKQTVSVRRHEPVAGVPAKYNIADRWTKRDGKSKKIAEMDTSHIQNILMYIKRRAKSIDMNQNGLSPFSEGYNSFRALRHAQLYFDQKLSQTPLYLGLIDELKKRGPENEVAQFLNRLEHRVYIE